MGLNPGYLLKSFPLYLLPFITSYQNWFSIFHAYLKKNEIMYLEFLDCIIFSTLRVDDLWTAVSYTKQPAQLIHEIWEMADEVGIFQVTKRIYDIIA